MRRFITVPLRNDPEVFDALVADARKNLRDPRSHAAWLIRAGLERAGVLPIKGESNAEEAASA